MNQLVEAFRQDPYDERFLSFKRLPTYGPGCHDAEPNYLKVLSRGVVKLDDFLFDPIFPTSVLAGLLRTNVVLDADWFGSESVLEGKLVLLKGRWFDTNPRTPAAIFPGAVSALTEIDHTLYIARPDVNSFVVHRPVISLSEEQKLRKYLRAKVPDFFTR